MAETTTKSFEGQEEESQGENQVDFVADPVSEEDLEDVSGGCTNCTNGCSENCLLI
jgi:hypothetical protein